MYDAICWYRLKFNLVFAWIIQLTGTYLTFGFWRPQYVLRAQELLQAEAERQGFHLTGGGFDGYA